MRIVRLDLLRFGPFTNQSLDFGESGPGLHLIYGPNEAGKSSALRALKHALYGIPSRTDDVFLHPSTDLRIGATLSLRDGRTLSFIRRKGNKSTLRAADDEQALDDRSLAPFLGDLAQQDFERRYGIDYEELLRGGEAVAAGEGDLASILFAAGTGITNLPQIQQNLDEEARGLFKSGGSKPPINVALSQIRDRRADINKARVRTADWKKHDDERRDAQERLDTIRAQRDECRAKLARLQRWEQALENAATRRDRLAEFEQLGEVRLLPIDAAERRLATQKKHREAEVQLQQLDSDLKRVDHELASLPPTTPVLREAERIEELQKALGSYQKAQRDRAVRVSERNERRKEVATWAFDHLRREAEFAELAQLRVPETKRKKISTLADSLDKFANKHDELGRRRQDLERKRTEAERKLSQLGAPPDCSDFERVIQRVRKQAALEEQRDKLRRELDLDRHKLTQAVERLGLWHGPLESLVRLKAPNAATVDRWRKELDDHQRAVESAEHEQAALHAKRDQLDTTLATIDQGGEVPTDVTLAAARQRRDQGWRLARQTLDGQPAAPDAVANYLADSGGARSLGEAIERDLLAADRVSDLMRSEADRVARKHEAIAQRLQLDAQLARQDARRADARQARETAIAEWGQLWQALGITPLSPAEMERWLVQLEKIVQSHEFVTKQTAELDDCEQRIGDQLRALRDAWPASSSAPPAATDESLTVALGRAEGQLDAWKKLSEQERQLRGQIAECEQDQRDIERQVESLQAERTEQAASWEREIVALSLSGQATTAEARERLLELAQLQKLTQQVADLDERIAGIDHDAAEFRERVRTLLADCELDPDSMGVEAAPGKLLELLKREREVQLRRDDLSRERARLSADLLRHRQTLEVAQRELDQLCAEAGVASSAELPEAESRSDRHRTLTATLKDLERQLTKLAIPEPLDNFVAQVLAQDREQLGQQIDQLREQCGQFEAAFEDAVREATALDADARRFDGEASAAEAELELEHLLAKLQEDAREYARIRLASDLLRRAVERYRERSQGPLVRRAGELFAAMTLGSFTDLRVDVDEQGRPTLCGIRAKGRQTDISGMSTGTRDQLYLALRLASLESTAAAQETPPLIVDDICVQFDDTRTAATLRILAELAQSLQVIVFTHHQHLVELTRATLPASAYRDHQLDRAAGI